MVQSHDEPPQLRDCQLNWEKCFETIELFYKQPLKATSFEELLDIGSYSLLTLIMNQGVAFLPEELAAHMPFDIDILMFKRQLERFVQSTDCLAVSLDTPTITIKNRCRKSLERVIAELEGGIPSQLFGYTTPDDEQIADVHDSTLEYYDMEQQIERSMIIEESNPRRQMTVYAWPCRFLICYLNQVPDTDVDIDVFATAISQMKSISHHYGDYFKIYVGEKFSHRQVQSSSIYPTALLTWGDYQRFLDVSYFENLARAKPTVSEWARLMTTKNIASYTVLDILKERAHENENV